MGEEKYLMFNQPFLLCPEGHAVYIRAWNRGSDFSRGIRDGRKCRYCEKVYSIEELAEPDEKDLIRLGLDTRNSH